MTEQNITSGAGLIDGLIRQARLSWRLLRDNRVPGWVKLIPFAGLLYFLSPIDLLPDVLLPGLGEIDDVALLLIALKLFVEFSPANVVSEHLDSITGRRGRTRPSEKPTPAQGETIDAPYRVLGPGAE
jgi:uncharacterized membrane protein YkvA (DUF1232 family)